MSHHLMLASSSAGVPMLCWPGNTRKVIGKRGHAFLMTARSCCITAGENSESL